MSPLLQNLGETADLCRRYQNFTFWSSYHGFVVVYLPGQSRRERAGPQEQVGVIKNGLHMSATK